MKNTAQLNPLTSLTVNTAKTCSGVSHTDSFYSFSILFDVDHSGVTTVSRFLEGSGPSRGARARRRFYYPTLSRVFYTCLSTSDILAPHLLCESLRDMSARKSQNACRIYWTNDWPYAH